MTSVKSNRFSKNDDLSFAVNFPLKYKYFLLTPAATSLPSMVYTHGRNS